MNIRLDPPPVSPLSPSERTRLRHRIMTASAPGSRGRRQWAASAVAVAAVGAVITGTLVVANQLQASEPPAATAAAVPPAISIDRGPLTSAEETAAAKTCPQPADGRSQPIWSRKVVVDPTAPKTRVEPVLLVRSQPRPKNPVYGLGLWVCFPGGGTSAIRDDDWAKEPTPAQGQVTLAGLGLGSTDRGKPTNASYRSIHRVRPEIDRLQARLVWNSGQEAGEWYEAPVANGFAYSSVFAEIPAGQELTVDPKTGATDQDVELRAFDAAGNPVPVQS